MNSWPEMSGVGSAGQSGRPFTDAADAVEGGCERRRAGNADGAPLQYFLGTRSPDWPKFRYEATLGRGPCQQMLASMLAFSDVSLCLSW